MGLERTAVDPLTWWEAPQPVYNNVWLLLKLKSGGLGSGAQSALLLAPQAIFGNQVRPFSYLDKKE